MTHMAEEIAQSGAAAARCLGENAQTFAALGERLRASDPAVVVTIARGSSDHAALYLKYLIEIGSAALRLDRAIDRLALSRAAAARRGRGDDDLAIGPQPRHRRRCKRPPERPAR